MDYRICKSSGGTPGIIEKVVITPHHTLTNHAIISLSAKHLNILPVKY